MLSSLICLLGLALPVGPSRAVTLDSSNVRIEWQVVNRFRLFRDAEFFRLHDSAWRQYLLHVDGRAQVESDREEFVQRTSVLGSEHVLNDRRIAFTNVIRRNFDWRGWAARRDAALCYDEDKRQHTACGGIDGYLTPKSHGIELWLTSEAGTPLPPGLVCEWRIGGALVATANCRERISGAGVELPWPGGADISVNVVGEPPVFLHATVRDLLIAGLGDSFASGEGNPNHPVEFSGVRRFRNLYPVRRQNDAGGSALWTDRLCHRSLYGQQLRAALQIAIENRHAAVTFLDYSCSGASVEAGILGPQYYVERVTEVDVSSQPSARPLSGGSKDSQIYRILRELCRDKPVDVDGLWTCPDRNFRRPLDLVFLSVGGNDIGFSNVVAWATLRDGVSARIAKLFGATVSAREFRKMMREVLPVSYARLARALDAALPLYSAGDGIFDPSRVVLTAYPDLVTAETGGICAAKLGRDGVEDRLAVNQSLDMFSSWLVADAGRLAAVRSELGNLYKTMRDLAGDHGWTFAGRVYADRMFEGHGFCARNPRVRSDPAEVLIIPCWGKAERDTATCESSWTGKVKSWRPYNPATENYPYALRQRWVRTFNDAYMVINQKVIDRAGRIDDEVSAGVFSETTGALHPTAEGHAAMADALLLSVRPMISEMLEGN